MRIPHSRDRCDPNANRVWVNKSPLPFCAGKFMCLGEAERYCILAAVYSLRKLVKLWRVCSFLFCPWVYTARPGIQDIVVKKEPSRTTGEKSRSAGFPAYISFHVTYVYICDVYQIGFQYSVIWLRSQNRCHVPPTGRCGSDADSQIPSVWTKVK